MSSSAARQFDDRFGRLSLTDLELPGWWAPAALALLLVAGGALLTHETRGTTFFQDEWEWILTRRGGGLGTFLTPHNQHLSLVPVIIYKLLFATVGMRHYWPYRACVILAQLTCVTLVFAYARPRIGSWFALLAAALILFFGPGWQDILWPFQMAWVIAVAAGIGALIALDSDTPIRNVCACALLAVSLASAGPGLAVAAGLIVEVVWRRPRRELWIVAVPVGLYALWWIGYQQASLVSSSLLLMPRFIFDSAAGVLSSLTGLAQVNVTADTGTYLQAGPMLVAIGVAIVAVRLTRPGRIAPRVLTLAVIPLSFWLIAGIGRANARVGGVILTFTGDEGRYLYVGAVWTLLFAVELARPLKPRPWAIGIVTVLAAAAVISNFGVLQDGAGLLRAQAPITDAEIGTLDMTRDIVPPSFASNGFVFFAYLTAGNYFAAERALGTSAATPAQLAADPAGATAAADAQLIRIHNPTLIPTTVALSPPKGTPPIVNSVGSGTVSIHSGCITWRPPSSTLGAAGAAIALTLPSGGLLLRALGASAAVSIRRFSPTFEPLGTLSRSATAKLAIAPDLSRAPWHVQIVSSSRILACAL